MSNLKLAKLPDRTPVKITVTLSPELHKVLHDYADDYNRTYGNTELETVSELVPYMLQSFLDSDRAFVRAQKQRRRDGEILQINNADRSRRRARSPETSS